MGKTVEVTDCFKCHRELFCPYKFRGNYNEEIHV
jgi:hypothetical protein